MKTARLNGGTTWHLVSVDNTRAAMVCAPKYSWPRSWMRFGSIDAIPSCEACKSWLWGGIGISRQLDAEERRMGLPANDTKETA